MTTLALIHPTDLLAGELRDTLEKRRELWRELRLLAVDDAEVGTLTEVRGAAAMVGAVEADSFDGVDVAFFFGPPESYRAVLDALPESTVAVVMAGGSGAHQGRPVVAGINLDAAEPGRTLLSPHAGAVALAHLLDPLRPFRPTRAVATVLQPASVYGREGLDEMFGQTRDILNFASEIRRSVLPGRLAFNLLHPGDSTADIEAQLRAVLGDEVPPVSVQLLQAGVFHGFSVSLHVELGDEPGLDELRAALLARPSIRSADEPGQLGPPEAAAAEQLLLGHVEPAAGGGYKLWAVMDNLTLGSALNAVAILEALAQPTAH